MNLKDTNWNAGEIATLGRKEMELKKRGNKSFASLIWSQYICVREATKERPGILVKVLGKTFKENIMLVNGEPFCKDDRDDLFVGRRYSSYPFPKVSTLKEVLNIIRSNKSIMDKFEEQSMHINPDSTFWVRETANRLMLCKKPQYYDASSGKLFKAKSDSAPYRLTIAYFNNNDIFL